MSEVKYEACIGLETHVMQKTRTKMFCGCKHEYGAPPNTNVCPVCLGYPGAMPVMNELAIELICKAGLLLGCEINPYSTWDRKNYFYPDMAKNYQITQADQPICIGGEVPVEVNGEMKVFTLERIHQEENAAKNTHVSGASLIDYNRAGTALMEIVSNPCMHSADDAFAYIHTIKLIMEYGGISNCDMEKGQMRSDVNISVRPVGQEKLGEKVEIKNMNSPSFIVEAINYEVERQIELIESGGELPIDLSDVTIYYVGPTPAPPGAAIGSAGPTSSYRMDPYSPLLIARGQTGMIGKGPRGPEVLAAMREYGAVYFAAVGGVAALISRTIKSYKIVAYDDLGAEALARITVEGFPCIVAQDSVGGDLYER